VPGVSNPRVLRAVADAASLCLCFKARKIEPAENSEKSVELLKFGLVPWRHGVWGLVNHKSFMENDLRK